jgi:hypothetical protein
MPRYASQTEVTVDRSRSEIERTLARYGADQFIYGWNAKGATVGFRMCGRMIRFNLVLPPKDNEAFTRTPGGRRERSSEAALVVWEQACRQRWRALALVIKAKLEAVESGITTFEDEFLGATLLPDGKTVAESIGGQITDAYRSGNVPKLLPMLEG